MDTDTDIDMNIDNYSVDDIMDLLSLQNPTEFQIKDTANRIIAKMKVEGDSPLILFFEQARDKALKSLLEPDDADDENKLDQTSQLGNWWPQTQKRNQPVQIFKDNNHFQMHQPKLNINQHYQLPVAEDAELNPTLKNTIHRLVAIDSQYRQHILPYLPGDVNSPTYNTDFTVNLTDNLNKVLKMTLYSVQIPTTWYTFDDSIGNLCFDYINSANPRPLTLQISSGNYTLNELGDMINAVISSNGITDLTLRIVNREKGGIFQFLNNSFNPVTLLFYSPDGFTNCRGGCGPSSKMNQHLGWNLGFRLTPDPITGQVQLVIPGNGGTGTGNVPPDLYGPKYMMLIVDDYNQNHLNNGLVNINDTVSKLNLPTYYAPDVNLNNVICTPTPFLTATSPRTLTQAQIYSANEILANRKKASNRTTGPTNSDVLALIPLQNVTSRRPDPYIEFGTNLQSNERTYFGPVNIDRLRIKLVDDKGNTVNLHDHDWSFTLAIEQLYQY